MEQHFANTKPQISDLLLPSELICDAPAQIAVWKISYQANLPR